MDLTPYTFELRDGWPPDGEPGSFFGFDADWRPCLLRWRDGDDPCWLGVRFMSIVERYRTPVEAFRRGKDTEAFVVKWARAPAADL